MQAYRVFYDKNDNKWKYENFLTEVGHTTDFQHWNGTLLGAESACIHYNNDFVENAEDMYSNNHYTICTCKDCEADYILTSDEYFWFLDRGLSVPKRCPKCRSRRRNK